MVVVATCYGRMASLRERRLGSRHPGWKICESKFYGSMDRRDCCHANRLGSRRISLWYNALELAATPHSADSDRGRRHMVQPSAKKKRAKDRKSTRARQCPGGIP